MWATAVLASALVRPVLVLTAAFPGGYGGGDGDGGKRGGEGGGGSEGGGAEGGGGGAVVRYTANRKFPPIGTPSGCHKYGPLQFPLLYEPVTSPVH